MNLSVSGSPMELVFAGRRDADIPCSLTLRNTSNTPLAYKVTAIASSIAERPRACAACGGGFVT